MDKIWIVEKCGDEYHGSSVVAWFDRQSQAIAWAKEQENKQDPCEDCGHIFQFVAYSIPRGKHEKEKSL